MDIDLIKSARKSYSRVGLELFIFTIIIYAVQIGLIFAEAFLGLSEEFVNSVNNDFIMMIISIYICGAGSLFLMSRKQEKYIAPDQKLGFVNFFLYAWICIGLCVGGSFIGNIADTFCLNCLGIEEADTSGLDEIMKNSSLIPRVLVVGMIGPFFEELIFRKFIIDHTLKYGELMSIIVSGFLFGFFHGNFQQFFYATALGFLFAYVYVRTGRLRYSVGLHMTVNLISSVISVFFLKSVDFDLMEELIDDEELYMQAVAGDVPERFRDAWPAIQNYLTWNSIYFFLGIIGLIILFVKLALRSFHLKQTETDIPKGKRFSVAFGNVGMILVIVIFAALFAFSYFVQLL